MGTKLLTEQFAFSGGRVDRAAGTIADCLICGSASANGRDYPWGGALRESYRKYEGAPSNCDHGKDETIDRRIGWFTDVKPGTDGKPRGTFNLLKAHPMYERVMEAAERNPRLFGFSHVVEAKTSRKNGREIVESIESVVSIDLVATPATTKSFFESTGRAAVPQIKFRELIEAVLPKLPPERAKPVRKWLVLAEDDAGMAPMLDAPVDAPADDADGGDAMDDAFKQLMHTSLDKLLDESHTIAEFLKNIRAIYKTRAQVTGAGGSGAAADTGGDDEPAEESKRLAPEAVIAECKAAQFAPSYEQGESLRNIADKTTRAVVIESFKARDRAAGGEAPRAAGRARLTTEQKDKPADAAPSLDEIKKRMRA